MLNRIYENTPHQPKNLWKKFKKRAENQISGQIIGTIRKYWILAHIEHDNSMEIRFSHKSSKSSNFAPKPYNGLDICEKSKSQTIYALDSDQWLVHLWRTKNIQHFSWNLNWQLHCIITINRIESYNASLLMQTAFPD